MEISNFTDQVGSFGALPNRARMTPTTPKRAVPGALPRAVPEKMEMIAGTGHFIPEDAPERFNETLEELIESLVTSREMKVRIIPGHHCR